MLMSATAFGRGALERDNTPCMREEALRTLRSKVLLLTDLRCYVIHRSLYSANHHAMIMSLHP